MTGLDMPAASLLLLAGWTVAGAPASAPTRSRVLLQLAVTQTGDRSRIQQMSYEY